MADRFISDTKTTYQLGQTVIAKVTNLDEEKRRFLVTLKISEVISPVGDVLTRLINGLEERKAMTEMLSARGTITITCLSNILPTHPKHLDLCLEAVYST